MNLFVGNLSPETTAESLRKLFSEFGEIVSYKVIYDNATGMSRGFGFVEMADKFHSYDAIDNLDAIFFEGSVISVKEAKGNATKGGAKKPFRPKPQRPGGGGFTPRPRPEGGYTPRPRPEGGYTPRPRREDDFNKL